MPFLIQGKTNIVYILIVVILAAIAGGVIFSYQYWWLPKQGMPEINEYYKDLANKCESKSCCLESVNRMVAGNYKLSPEKGCPEGFQGNMLRCESSYKWCEPKADETADCFKKYPKIEFEGCVPGKVVDGWEGIILYPNTLDTSNVTHYTDAPAPDVVKQASVASYGISHSTCQTIWRIKINGEWKEVNQLDFCNFIIEYNSSCNECLLEWEEGCC